MSVVFLTPIIVLPLGAGLKISSSANSVCTVRTHVLSVQVKKMRCIIAGRTQNITEDVDAKVTAVTDD